MKDLGHGANINLMAKKYNKSPKNILDFSSNINPKLISNLETYILEGLKECTSYPDINYTSLRNNISEYIGINPDFIIPGNGATEIIYLMMKSINKRLAIFNPTFSEYKRSAELNGLEILHLNLDKSNNFEISLDEVKSNIDKFDSLFVCNPNNPNGKVKNLEKLLELIVKNNKLLIVDETFMEFVEKEEDYSLIKYVDKNENLFILKAVTKFFGMPGLRLGYGVTSNKEIINKIYTYKEPWTINSFADNLSNYIFKDKDYIEESKEFYIKERTFMLESLRKNKLIEVYDTDTNFILIKLNKFTASDIKEKLFLDSNILIRDASNFIGLDNSYIRVAIKSRRENEILIKELNKFLGD
ncbi:MULTISPECIES: pyridoxal phosphate-dependent aminotransferase [unclassified Romboutsia]|uniref:pyridoxal phosphate-dependent aminotransferase n=1 Tax=unclassified Romboutsia TaxID=2626894 RepID=UPI0008229898|nr:MULTISPECIES: histidinol-phosphate transaminase [unclassified Romboutsia]SCI42994.1 Threonine-phosphate decarboxylase [uncultured Clostridium sp.]